MLNLKKEKYFQILFFLSIAILIIAYAIEYILGYKPCNLCLIERIPYILAIIVLILSFKFKKNQVFFTILLVLIFSFSFIISVYHFSIEQGFIDESTLCKSENIELITKEDVLKSLQNLNISCKNVAFKIFGLSLTTYNIIISLLMTIITIKIYLIKNDLKN